MTLRRFPRSTLVAVASVVVLTGCPLPILPGYLSLSRENIGEQVPDFIVEGQTTREDVLLRLGEPDWRGPGDRWFNYGSTYRQGGVALIAGSVGGVAGVAMWSTRNRRIDIRFDALGVVTKVEFLERVCPKSSFAMGSLSSGGGFGGESSPCFDVTGGWTTEDAPDPGVVTTVEATATPSATIAVPASVASVPATKLALTPWFDGAALWRPGLSSRTRGAKPPAAGVRGRLVVSADGVVFFERLGSDGSEAPYQVARESIIRTECALPSFALLRTDGTREHFIVLSASGEGYDHAMTERVCRLVGNSLTSAPQ